MIKTLTLILLFVFCFIFCVQAYPSYPGPPPAPQLPRDGSNDHWILNLPHDWSVGQFDFEYPYVKKIMWEPIWGDRIGLGIKAESQDAATQIFYSWLDGSIISDGGFGPNHLGGFIRAVSQQSNLKFTQNSFGYQSQYNYVLNGTCEHPLWGEGKWQLQFWDHVQDCHVILIVYFGEGDSEVNFQESQNFLIKQ